MHPKKKDYSNILIVEGDDDKYAILGLVGRHIPWPSQPEQWPVWIEVGKSVEEILAYGYLTAELKAANARKVGVVVDADQNSAGRYIRIRQLCSALFPDLPEVVPPDGLVQVNADDKTLGVWVMPDNASTGGLEEFVASLVPAVQGALWSAACSSVESAMQLGATCRDPHRGKANLYTWLAWQDPPGQSPGRALIQNILDAQSAKASAFVAWFKRLYNLES